MQIHVKKIRQLQREVVVLKSDWELCPSLTRPLAATAAGLLLRLTSILCWALLLPCGAVYGSWASFYRRCCGSPLVFCLRAITNCSTLPGFSQFHLTPLPAAAATPTTTTTTITTTRKMATTTTMTVTTTTLTMIPYSVHLDQQSVSWVHISLTSQTTECSARVSSVDRVAKNPLHLRPLATLNIVFSYSHIHTTGTVVLCGK